MYYLSEIPEKVSTDYLKTKLRQEDIYEYYLGIIPKIGKKYTNPLRDDKRADCSFYWYGDILWFKDFPKNKTYNCFTIVKEKYGLSWYQSLEKIAKEMIAGTPVYCQRFELDRASPKERIEKDVQVTIQPLTDMDKAYLNSYHITSIAKYRVYSVKHYWVDGIFRYTYSNHNPCIGYYVGAGKWKLYFYKNSQWRFMGNIGGDTLQGFDQLPLLGDKLVITKSMKDVMVFDIFDIYAVAPHTEAVPTDIDKLQWLPNLRILQARFDKIYLNFDNDEVGRDSASRLVSVYPHIIPIFIPDESGKDISDFIKLRGVNQTKELLTTLIT